MAALWTSAEAEAATGGRATRPFAATGVSIDTRTLCSGDLFVALKDVRDGHDFVAEALRRGAAAALVSRVPEGCGADAPLLVVPDVLVALCDLGRAGRARAKARVVAVTGSVGKTSTKEMLRVVLEGQGSVDAAEAAVKHLNSLDLGNARIGFEPGFMPSDAYRVIEAGVGNKQLVDATGASSTWSVTVRSRSST